MKFNELTDRMKTLVLTGIIHDMAKLEMPRLVNFEDRLQEIGLEIVPLGEVDGMHRKLKDAEAIMDSNDRTIKELEHRLANATSLGHQLKEDEIYPLINLLRDESISAKAAGERLALAMGKYSFLEI